MPGFFFCPDRPGNIMFELVDDEALFGNDGFDQIANGNDAEQAVVLQNG
jgi:hypothetical protein